MLQSPYEYFHLQLYQTLFISIVVQTQMTLTVQMCLWWDELSTEAKAVC